MICSLKFKKDVVILKMLLWILCFGFEVMRHPSCYLTFIMDKTHHGLIIALFCATSAAFLVIEGIPVTNHFSLLLRLI